MSFLNSWFVEFVCVGNFHGLHLFAQYPHILWTTQTKVSSILIAIACGSQRITNDCTVHSKMDLLLVDNDN